MSQASRGEGELSQCKEMNELTPLNESNMLLKKPWESKDPCIPNNEEDAWTHSATAAAVGCFLINLSSNE